MKTQYVVLTEREIAEFGECYEVIELPVDGGASVQKIRGVKTTEVIVSAALGLTLAHTLKIETDFPGASGVYRVVQLRKHANRDDLVVATIERVN